MLKSFVLGIVLLSVLIPAAYADAPRTISYQAVLRDAGGAPVPDGMYEITFRIYNVDEGGEFLWNETDPDSALVVGGVCNAVMGKVSPLNLDFDQTYWLGILINGGDELSPRAEFAASPYSFRAMEADHAVVADSAVVSGSGGGDDGDWIVDEPNMYSGVPGKIGIGTTNPAFKLDIQVTDEEGGGGLRISTESNVIARLCDMSSTLDHGALSIYDTGNERIKLFANTEYPSWIDIGNMGIGTRTPAAKLDVNGTVKMTGFKMPTGAGSGKVLTSNSSGVGTWETVEGGIGGSGSGGYIPKFTYPTTLGLSAIYQSGSLIGIGTTSPEHKLHVEGGNIVVRGGHLYVQDSDAENTLILSNVSGEPYRLLGNASKPLHLGTNNNYNMMTFIPNGNVGIGTTNPFCALHVEAGDNAAAEFRSATTSDSEGVVNIQYTGTNDQAVGIRVGCGPEGCGTGGMFSGGRYGVFANVYTPTPGWTRPFESVHADAVGYTTSAMYGVRANGLNYDASGESYGVYAGASGAGTNYGVYGKAVDGTVNYAGYFVGNVHVIGNLSCTGVKPFKIDHPFDPANKYLHHFCLESDEVLNVYSGNVALDAAGVAWVELPDYFEEINRDPRYQLTCIGGFAQVYVAEKISNNRFKIAGGQPGLEISCKFPLFGVTPAAEKFSLPVEMEKPSGERGKYLNPDLYGAPASMGIGYVDIEEDKTKP